MLKRRRDERRDGESAAKYEHLRAQALRALDLEVLPPPPAAHPHVAGLVVDVPASGGYFSVIALADGTTSTYTSKGGRIIGAGEHVTVAAATRHLLAAVERQLELFTIDDDGSLPGAGAVRFHVLSLDRRRMTDVPEDAFWGRIDHPLRPVVAQTQNVIAAVREVHG